VQRAGEWYCLELAGRAGLEPSTTYQVLHRLQRHGFVQSRWEDIDPHTAARPRRCYWRLTPDGAALADTAPADPGFTNPEFTNAGFTNAVPEGSA
jgi:DNA-binding PadR family transcriptional regulator